jgi:hypothetical protein
LGAQHTARDEATSVGFYQLYQENPVEADRLSELARAIDALSCLELRVCVDGHAVGSRGYDDIQFIARISERLMRTGGRDVRDAVHEAVGLLSQMAPRDSSLGRAATEAAVPEVAVPEVAELEGVVEEPSSPRYHGMRADQETQDFAADTEALSSGDETVA